MEIIRWITILANTRLAKKYIATLQKLKVYLTLIYGTHVPTLTVLLVFPIIALFVTYIQSSYYDINEFDIYSSIGFGVANLATTFSVHIMTYTISWHYMEKRVNELNKRLFNAQLCVGVTLSKQYIARINTCRREMYNTMCIYFVPLQLYKVGISAMWSLFILPSLYYFIGICILFGITTGLLNVVTRRMKLKMGKNVCEKINFDPENPDGYTKPKLEIEKNMSIIDEFDNVTDTKMRMSLGHTLSKNSADEIRSKYQTQRSIMRTVMLDIMGSIVFVILLATSTRSLAQNITSILVTIGNMGETLYKLDSMYLLDNLSYILVCLEKNCRVEPILPSIVMDVNTITIQNATLSYRDIFIPSKQYVRSSGVTNLSCIIKKGSLHYITGENGVGKSSFLKMFFDTLDSGKILFDSTNITNIDQKSLWQLVYILKQINEDVPMFSRDIIDHHKKINPDLSRRFGIDSLEGIGRDGSSGSGGQEQRVQIFMALTTSASVILLDEPFSALDVHWKQVIEKELIEMATTKIIIVIGHGNYDGADNKGVTKWIMTKSDIGDTMLQCQC